MTIGAHCPVPEGRNREYVKEVHGKNGNNRKGEKIKEGKNRNKRKRDR
jgi:hypothetical protein